MISTLKIRRGETLILVFADSWLYQHQRSATCSNAIFLDSDAVPADDLSQFQTLSQYKAEFESSLVPSAAPELSQ